MWGSENSLLEAVSAIVIFLAFVLCLCGSVVLYFTPPTHLLVVSSLYLYLLKIFSGGFWFFSSMKPGKNLFSVYCYSLGMSMRGGEDLPALPSLPISSHITLSVSVDGPLECFRGVQLSL